MGWVTMNNKKSQLRLMSILTLFFLLLLTLIGVAPVVSAGFASSYVPTIDGKQVVISSSGETYSYYIYLQNQGDEDINNAIRISNGKNLLTNSLLDYYTVPKNTESDEYPVELKFKTSTASSGTVYQISYTVSTSTVSEDGVVTFNPVGFDKTFYISIGTPDWDKLVIDASPVEDEPVPAPSSGGGGGGSIPQSTTTLDNITESSNKQTDTPNSTVDNQDTKSTDTSTNGLQVIDSKFNILYLIILLIIIGGGIIVFWIYNKFKQDDDTSYYQGGNYHLINTTN